MRAELTDGTVTGRVLTRTERLLADYLGNERQAIALAPYVEIIEQSTDIEQVVIRALVSCYEARNGLTPVEYVGGERRDDKRG